jgi:hypothetical protein
LKRKILNRFKKFCERIKSKKSIRMLFRVFAVFGTAGDRCPERLGPLTANGPIAECPTKDARELEAALRAAGFETRTFVVREPR